MENLSKLHYNKWNKINKELWLIVDVEKVEGSIQKVDKLRNLRKKFKSVWVKEKKKEKKVCWKNEWSEKMFNIRDGKAIKSMRKWKNKPLCVQMQKIVRNEWKVSLNFKSFH